MGRISIRIKPRGRGNEIVGWREGALVVRVTAPPVDGRANEALCELLAARLGVPKRSVFVVQGTTARDKVVEVTNLSADELKERLASG